MNKTKSPTPQSSKEKVLPFADNWGVVVPFVVHFFIFGVAWALQLVFLGVWVIEKGLSATAIGSIIFTGMISRLCLTPVLSQICDRLGNRWLVLAILYGALLFPITVLMMLEGLPTWAVYWLSVAYGGLLGTTLMTLESYTVLCSRRMHFAFPFIRGFLSLGFALGSVALGIIFEWTSITLFAPVACMTFLVVFLSLLFVARTHSTRQHKLINPLYPLRSKGLLPLIILTFFTYFSMSPFMGLSVVYYVKYMGFTASDMGLIVGIGVLLEAVLFLWAGQKIQRINNLFLFSSVGIILSFVRYGLYLYWDSLGGMIVLHALHGAQFVVIHSIVTEFIRRYIPPSHISSAQGLYEIFLISGFGSGAGLAGYLYDTAGGISMVYMSLISTLIATAVTGGYMIIQQKRPSFF